MMMMIMMCFQNMFFFWIMIVEAPLYICDINYDAQSNIGGNRRRAVAHGTKCPVCGEHHMYMGRNGQAKESSWLADCNSGYGVISAREHANIVRRLGGCIKRTS